MSDQTDVIGVASRFSPSQSGRVNMRLTQFASQAMAQVEPPGYEMTRAGKRYNLCTLTTVTGIAPVQAVPTTTAHWVLWNPSTTKSFVLETIGMYPASGTAGVGGQVLAALTETPATAITALATGCTVASASLNGVASAAFIKANVTLPANNGWFPVAETVSPNVGAYPGSGVIVNRNIAGKIIVPPLRGLALATLALAGTTPLFVPILEWLEIVSDNE